MFVVMVVINICLRLGNDYGHGYKKPTLTACKRQETISDLLPLPTKWLFNNVTLLPALFAEDLSHSYQGRYQAPSLKSK